MGNNKKRKQTIILANGYPSTGKTVSTKRLYSQLLSNYRVVLLSTLSIRNYTNLMGDLHSGKIREKVYSEIVKQTEQNIKEDNTDVIIIDGNFGKRSVREKIFDIADRYDASIFIIECTVDSEEIIKQRMAYRKRHEDDIQHKASSMDLYYLIQDQSDQVYDDVLPDGKKPIIMEYNTEKQSLTLHYNTFFKNNEIAIVGEIYKSLLPPTPVNKNKKMDTKNMDISTGIKAIIFDIGGVVQGERWELVTNRVSKFKSDLTMDQFRNAFYFEKEKYFGLYETSKMSSTEFWTMVATRLGISAEHINEISDAFMYLHSPVDDVMKDIIRILSEKYKLFTLSNSCPELERAILKNKGVYRYFDRMYFSHRICHKKPSIESYQYVLNDNGLKGEECIFIDDVARNILAAEELGIMGVFFVSPEQLYEDLKGYM